MLQSYEMEFDKFLKRQNKSVYISVNAFLEKSFYKHSFCCVSSLHMQISLLKPYGTNRPILFGNRNICFQCSVYEFNGIRLHRFHFRRNLNWHCGIVQRKRFFHFNRSARLDCFRLIFH